MDRSSVYCSLVCCCAGVEGYERIGKDMKGKRWEVKSCSDATQVGLGD